MRYLYCPECERLQKRNWYSRGRCEICRSECEVIEVESSLYGKASYVLAAIVFLMLLSSILHDPFGVSAFDFMADVVGPVFNGSVFVLIGVMFVLTFIDIGITRKRAEAIIIEGDGHDLS